MASIEQKYPLNYKVRGDTLDDFGYKYLMESERIFNILNMLRENREGEYEPQPHQIKISETGKFYVRNTDNTAWVYMGEINKENFDNILAADYTTTISVGEQVRINAEYGI